MPTAAPFQSFLCASLVFLAANGASLVDGNNTNTSFSLVNITGANNGTNVTDSDPLRGVPGNITSPDDPMRNNCTPHLTSSSGNHSTNTPHTHDRSQNASSSSPSWFEVGELGVSLAVVWAADRTAALLHLPRAATLVTIGAALGPEVLDFVPHAEALRSLGHLGLALMAVDLGLSVDVHNVRHHASRAAFMVMVCAVTASVVGTAVARWIFNVPLPAAVASGLALAPACVRLQGLTPHLRERGGAGPQQHQHQQHGRRGGGGGMSFSTPPSSHPPPGGGEDTVGGGGAPSPTLVSPTSSQGIAFSNPSGQHHYPTTTPANLSPQPVPSLRGLDGCDELSSQAGEWPSLLGPVLQAHTLLAYVLISVVPDLEGSTQMIGQSAVVSVFFLGAGSAGAVLCWPHWVARYFLPWFQLTAQPQALCVLLGLEAAVAVWAVQYTGACFLIPCFIAGLSLSPFRHLTDTWEVQAWPHMRWLVWLFVAFTVGFTIPIREISASKVLIRALALCLVPLTKTLSSLFARRIDQHTVVTLGSSLCIGGETALLLLLTAREEGILEDHNMYTAVVLTLALSELLATSALTWQHRSRQRVEDLTDVYLSAVRGGSCRDLHLAGGIQSNYYHVTVRCPHCRGFVDTLATSALDVTLTTIEIQLVIQHDQTMLMELYLRDDYQHHADHKRRGSQEAVDLHHIGKRRLSVEASDALRDRMDAIARSIAQLSPHGLHLKIVVDTLPRHQVAQTGAVHRPESQDFIHIRQWKPAASGSSTPTWPPMEDMEDTGVGARAGGVTAGDHHHHHHLVVMGPRKQSDPSIGNRMGEPIRRVSSAHSSPRHHHLHHHHNHHHPDSGITVDENENESLSMYFRTSSGRRHPRHSGASGSGTLGDVGVELQPTGSSPPRGFVGGGYPQPQPPSHHHGDTSSVGMNGQGVGTTDQVGAASQSSPQQTSDNMETNPLMTAWLHIPA